MDYYLIILRLLHIGTGAFWAGAAIYLAVFVLPAVNALGPDGGKFMQQLSNTNKLPAVLLINSSITVLSGILLLWHLSDGFTNDFLGQPMGIVLSIGATVAIIAYLIGVFVNRPAIMKIAQIGKEAAMKQQPPSAEQMQQLGMLRARVGSMTRLIAWMMGFVVAMMAIARYVSW